MAKNKALYANLKRAFHEPNRLSIVSALCSSEEGLAFNDLKAECDLTFGNLSSHLKTLQDADIIVIEKTFVQNKPRTTVFLTESGRDQFVAYLEALEAVLESASKSLNQKEASNLRLAHI